MKIKHILNLILWRTTKTSDESNSVKDQEIIETFIANPNNTFFVSFPRTGSHWLRMIMELYFGRPSLVRVFYYPEQRDYLTFHTHDLELDVERSNVIYLYRDPVDTVFSQLYYHKELEDRERISYWSDLYGHHLDKWLCCERFTTHKTILTYEGMKRDLVNEFAKVTRHFGEPLNKARLEEIAKKITKDEVKLKTKHDPQVVQLRANYEIARQEFRKKYGGSVWDVVARNRPYILDYFNTRDLCRSRGFYNDHHP